MSLKSISRGVAALLVTFTTSCIPLTVGSTARPVPVGERTSSTSVYVVPNSFHDSTSDRSLSRVGVDTEFRFGLDGQSDIGVRTTSFSGIVANYKRRLNGASDAPGTATAIMLGGGLLNWGDHAHVEATFIASGDNRGRVTPYGGIRAMQVFPINRGAVHDSPTIGAFFGTRIGNGFAGISPEIGVFYDRSALGIRNGNVLIVPAITIHGDFGRLRLPRRW
jgi:hypothetical protein